MKILGIDFGTKRIGLALYNDKVDVILPFGKVSDLDELARLIKQEEIEKIVLGMPVGLSGGENKNTSRVEDFASQLEKKTKIKVEFFDERFSSQQADSMGGAVSRDEKSAMVILNSYLEKN